MTAKLKRIADKVISKKESKTDKKASTKVVNTLDILIKKLIERVTEKTVVDCCKDAKQKDKKVTYKTKYFSVVAHYSQYSEREVNSSSREYLIQSMLLTDKSCKQIYNKFAMTFTLEKFADLKVKNNLKESFQEYIERRFNKYFKQECACIKKLHVINCKKQTDSK